VTRARRDRDTTAERLDRALDHVHADATAGNVGDLVGGRETGREDQVVDFFVGQVGIGGDQFVVDGLLLDALAVDTGAVVDQFDDDTARTMPPSA
jgi:hypothetical protein